MPVLLASSASEPGELHRVVQYCTQLEWTRIMDCPLLTVKGQAAETNELRDWLRQDVGLCWCLPKECPWGYLLASSLWVNRLYIRSGLVRKDLLCQALRASRKNSNLLPETHVVTDLDDIESLLGSQRVGVWVLKLSDSSNGHQITFLRSTPQGIEHARRVLEDSESGRRWVLQQCIERPHLINSRKYHMRAFMLIVGCLDAYVHRDVRLLVATEPYSDQDLGNRFVHVTNRSVQAQHPDYREDEQLLALDVLPDADRVFQDICSVCRQAVEALDQSSFRKWFFPMPRTFEVFGVDLMRDSSGGMWLLEVNACPSLWLSPNVIEDALDLTIARTPCNAVPTNGSPRRQPCTSPGRKGGMQDHPMQPPHGTPGQLAALHDALDLGTTPPGSPRLPIAPGVTACKAAVGVCDGEMVHGSSHSSDGGVSGPLSNAARMQAAAAPQGIGVSGCTQRHVLLTSGACDNAAGVADVAETAPPSCARGIVDAIHPTPTAAHGKSSSVGGIGMAHMAPQPCSQSTTGPSCPTPAAWHWEGSSTGAGGGFTLVYSRGPRQDCSSPQGDTCLAADQGLLRMTLP